MLSASCLPQHGSAAGLSQAVLEPSWRQQKCRIQGVECVDSKFRYTQMYSDVWIPNESMYFYVLFLFVSMYF